MAITVTVDDLLTELRLTDTTQERELATRRLAYASQAVADYLRDAFDDVPDAVVNEATIQIAGYRYDQPLAPMGSGYANALRNSGAGRTLLPYRIHRIGIADVAEVSTAVGSAVNPVTDVDYSGDVLTVLYADGTSETFTITQGSGGGPNSSRDLIVDVLGTVDIQLSLTRAWTATGITVPATTDAILIDTSAATIDYHVVDWKAVRDDTEAVAGQTSMDGEFETFITVLPTGTSHTLRIGHTADNEILLADDAVTGGVNIPRVRVERFLAPVAEVGGGSTPVTPVSPFNGTAYAYWETVPRDPADRNAGAQIPPAIPAGASFNVITYGELDFDISPPSAAFSDNGWPVFMQPVGNPIPAFRLSNPSAFGFSILFGQQPETVTFSGITYNWWTLLPDQGARFYGTRILHANYGEEPIPPNADQVARDAASAAQATADSAVADAATAQAAADGAQATADSAQAIANTAQTDAATAQSAATAAQTTADSATAAATANAGSIALRLERGDIRPGTGITITPTAGDDTELTISASTSGGAFDLAGTWDYITGDQLNPDPGEVRYTANAVPPNADTWLFNVSGNAPGAVQLLDLASGDMVEITQSSSRHQTVTVNAVPTQSGSIITVTGVADRASGSQIPNHNASVTIQIVPAAAAGIDLVARESAATAQTTAAAAQTTADSKVAQTAYNAHIADPSAHHVKTPAGGGGGPSLVGTASITDGAGSAWHDTGFAPSATSTLLGIGLTGLAMTLGGVNTDAWPMAWYDASDWRAVSATAATGRLNFRVGNATLIGLVGRNASGNVQFRWTGTTAQSFNVKVWQL
ncbi:MAG: hypothetical protein OXE87_01390 [Chloroflexi bacterium]|nr:hypothetical protein [Chloroflexota bacterium]